MKTIDFFLERSAHVLLSVRHLSGCGIATLVSDVLEPGEHHISLGPAASHYAGKMALEYDLTIDGQLKESIMFVPR